jgi:hypothetical protein
LENSELSGDTNYNGKYPKWVDDRHRNLLAQGRYNEVNNELRNELNKSDREMNMTHNSNNTKMFANQGQSAPGSNTQQSWNKSMINKKIAQ